MFRALAISIFIFNTSSATLHNVMVVAGDEATEIGSIESGVCKQVEIPPQDSIRVIFTLGQKREGWLETEKMSHCVGDTIIINDKIETFEMEVEIIE